MWLRKLIRILAYYVLPVGLWVVVLGVLYLDLPLPVSKFWVLAKLGLAAFLTLSVVLFIKPLSTLTSFKLFKLLMTYRREIGLASFWFFLFHALGLFLLKAYPLTAAFNPATNIFWGVLAAVGMTAMGVTANDTAIKALKANWKRLHKVAYPTYYLVLMHYVVAENDWTKLILFGGAYGILKILAHRRIKNLRS